MRVFENIIVTEDMVNNFALVSGDKNPIHLDNEYAKNTKFGGRIVHGMLLASFISKIVANNYPGEGSIYLEQDLKFKNPCYLNDTITVIIELINYSNNKYHLKTLVMKDDKVLIDGNALILKY